MWPADGKNRRPSASRSTWVVTNSAAFFETTPMTASVRRRAKSRSA